MKISLLLPVRLSIGSLINTKWCSWGNLYGCCRSRRWTRLSYTSFCQVHAMINVDNVTQWFRDAPSHNRLQVLCRLLECCVPHELQYLATFLEELLRRNMVLNAPSDATYANLKHLGEITDSNCRRQLCLLLTRLKSANKIPAYNIYDILIRYDFAKFFSRVISMEEELVDEILLLFTLAANHPAMTFSQRNRLSQRLVELRETIDQSFKVTSLVLFLKFSSIIINS